MRAFLRLAVAAGIVALAGAAEASVQYRIEDGALAPLSGPIARGGRVVVENVPLDGARATLELKEFDVLAPDAVIEVHREDGTVVRVAPQKMRQFRGSVRGTPQSLVYLSVGRDVQGLVFVRDRKFSVHSKPRARGSRGAGDHDVFVEEIPPQDDVLSAGGFMCGVEQTMLTPATASLPQSLTAGGVTANAFAWPTDSATTMLNMAVDTDSAMYANFGSSAAAVETYTRNLLGAASTIYLRDLRTQVRITLLSIWTSGGGADPFTVNPGSSSGTWNGVPGTAHTTSHALAEYGDWFHANRAATKRSAAMLLSGQTQRAGIAWIDVLCSSGGTCSGGNCGSATFDGHRFGSYSYNGGVGLDGASIPDPDAGVNYVAPSSNYWSLLQIAHELGHNVQSQHTHCIDTDPLTGGIQAVDACVGGCVTQGSVPAEKGTIMSYCHLRSPGFGTNTRYTFGQVGELSEIVLTNMRGRLDDITPTGLSIITAPASVTTGVTENASVTNTAGLTFDWTIENGTFTGGGTTATGASVSFSGTTNPVTLTVTATNASGCGISDSKDVTVNSVSFDPPANIVATALGPTSVQVTWSAVPGATTYKIFRASSAGSFTTEVGETGNLTFTDNSAAANTAYQYTVSAGVSPTFSTFGTPDLATTVIFTDPTLTAGTTAVSLAHFTQMLTAVNAVRTLGGIGTIAFTAPTPAGGVTLRAQHITDLRVGLDAGRAAIAMSGMVWTDDPLNAGTSIKAVHMTQLRAGVN